MRRTATAAVLVLCAVTGCGTTASGSAGGPSLLNSATVVLDASSTAHFVLTSAGVPSGASGIIGGSGDIARPDSIKGTFSVEAAGASVDIGVVATAGKFFVKLPFASSYTPANPAQLGLGDPSSLLNPNTGLSTVLSAIQGAQFTGSARIGREEVLQVAGTIPGTSVPVLPDADKAQPVKVVASIVYPDHQLRRITLTGPFLTSALTTYTLTLTNYGAPVAILLPSH